MAKKMRIVEIAATALDPNKNYILKAPNLLSEDAAYLQEYLEEMAIRNVIVVMSDLEIIEATKEK